jgi:hypothetical protein
MRTTRPAEPARYTCNHISLANPIGRDQGDLAKLLRRVANLITTLGNPRILDLIASTEINEHGDWWSVTVYYSDRDE